MPEIRERPIIFSAAMVRAILHGNKTQTRRIVKHKIPPERLGEMAAVHVDGGGNWIWWDTDRPEHAEFTQWAYPDGEGLPCPYGRPGDQLWVRETFYCNHAFYPDGTPPQCYWDGSKVRQKHTPEQFAQERLAMLEEMYYRADGIPDFEGEETGMQWRPSIYMPRWASRITLEITEVRVERLHAIQHSEADALAEGLIKVIDHPDIANFPARYGLTPETLTNRTAWAAYARLWNQINGEGSWDLNPWVFVIEFKRIHPINVGDRE